MTSSMEVMGRLLKIHVIFKGRSPLLTEQVVDVISPEFIGISPKPKGRIWGLTKKCLAG